MNDAGQEPAFVTPEAASKAKEDEADAAIASQDLEQALHCLNKAIFVTPENPVLYAKRAQLYWDLCDVQSAMGNYRKLFSIDSNPSQKIKDQFAAVLHLHAYSLLVRQELPSIAIAYLSESIQLNALVEGYWFHRAIAYLQANAYEKALKDLDHCICLNAKDVEYFVLRAKVHWRLHMHEKANADIQKATTLMPTHPEVIEHEQRLLRESQAIYERACNHLLVREFAPAIQFLNQATGLSPDDTKIYLLRASAYRELGEFHTALKDIDRALTCHRKKQLRHAKKTEGVAVLDGKDRSKQYREIASQRILILNEIGLQFLKDKAYQLALNALNQVIRGELELRDLAESDSERTLLMNPTYYVTRGDAYRGLGNFHAALADYHHALEYSPDSYEIRSRVALIHYQFGIQLLNQAQFPAAELEFQKAIAQDTTVATYFVRKGDCARFQEKHDVAMEDYAQALALNPRDEETKNKLRQYTTTLSVATKPVTTTATITTTNNQQLPMPTTTSVRYPHAPKPDVWKKVDDARQSYAQKHARVQELFAQRPSLQSKFPKKPSTFR